MKTIHSLVLCPIFTVFAILQIHISLPGQTLDPLSVTDNFIPSGYMGDGGIMDQNVVDPTRPDSQSIKVDYIPGAAGWGGIFWQFPADTWCTKPGWDLTGYTKLVLLIRGETGREVVRLKFGHDCESNKPAIAKRLTKDWQKVTISLTGLTLKSITGAFAWIVDSGANSGKPITFYLDDVFFE